MCVGLFVRFVTLLSFTKGACLKQSEQRTNERKHRKSWIHKWSIDQFAVVSTKENSPRKFGGTQRRDFEIHNMCRSHLDRSLHTCKCKCNVLMSEPDDTKPSNKKELCDVPNAIVSSCKKTGAPFGGPSARVGGDGTSSQAII